MLLRILEFSAMRNARGGFRNFAVAHHKGQKFSRLSSYGSAAGACESKRRGVFRDLVDLKVRKCPRVWNVRSRNQIIFQI